MKIPRVVFFALFLLPAAGQSFAQAPMSFEDVISVRRISEPGISPDGNRALFVVGDNDLEEGAAASSIWMYSEASGETLQMTRTGRENRHPRWSPDGKRITFLSDRAGKGQVRCPLPQSVEFYRGLKTAGVETRLVVYPREPHVFREPRHQLDKMEREYEWFRTHVLEPR